MDVATTSRASAHNRRTTPLTVAQKRPTRPTGRSPHVRSRREHIIGVAAQRHRERHDDRHRQRDREFPNIRPTMPPISRIGRNTAISEILSKQRLSRLPWHLAARPARAACLLDCRDMFSSTTIASSTTKPVATVSAINDRLSRRVSKQVHVAKVPAMDTGTATAADQRRRATAEEEEHHACIRGRPR